MSQIHSYYRELEFCKVPGRKACAAAMLILVFCSILVRAASAAEFEQFGSQAPTFTENRGQWDSQALYRASDGKTTMWFTRDAIYYQYFRSNPDQPISMQPRDPKAPRNLEQMIIKATFVDANPTPVLNSGRELEYKCNYFIGADESKWQTDVPNYESIKYKSLYEGIDVSFRSENNQIAAEFDIAANAGAQQVKVRYEGVRSVTVNSSGELVLETDWGALTVPRLIARVEDNTDISGAVRQELLDDNTVVWSVDGAGSSQRNVRLVVSPTYSTYLGGSSAESISDMALVSTGEVYLTGDTYSADFPMVNAYDPFYASEQGFVTKVAASGTSLVYSTYLGGTSNDRCTGLAYAGGGIYSVFVTGTTNSTNFPMVNPVDASANGNDDAFIASLGPNGNTLAFSTYFGGSTWESATDIAVACVFPCGVVERFAVWIVGNTQSANLPVVLAYSTTLSGFSDGFLASYTIGANGNTMGRCSYFGGSGEDFPTGVTLLATNPARPAITGYTRSSNFPLAMPYDATINGTQDAFLSAFAFAGNNVMYPTFSTYFGGNSSSSDVSYEIILRSNGNLCIAGENIGTGVATTGAFDSTSVGNDGFLAEFNLTTGALVACTYLGGSGVDETFDVFEKNGNLYCAGITTSSDLPMVDAWDNSISGTWDAYVAVFNSNMTSLLWSTFIGGTDLEAANCLAVDNAGYCIYVAGNTLSTNFPLINPYDPINNANSDGFLFKICVPLYTCGDADGNLIVTVSDAVYLINYIFAGGPAPNPLLSGDVDCNAIITISDAVYLINYIFSGGPAPCASCP